MVRCGRLLALFVALAATTLTRGAAAYHTEDERIVDGTAHTLRAREFRVGLWELEFAPFSFVTVGTDNAPWVAGLFLSSVVANGHAKLRILRTSPLTISVGGAAYYCRLRMNDAGKDTNGTLWLVPLSLQLSSDLAKPVSLHAGATYTFGDLDGDMDPSVYRTRVAIATRALQVHAGIELRASRVVAFLIEGHAQPYSAPATVRSRTTTPFGSSVDFNGTIEPVNRTAVAGTGSIILSGKNVNARFGAGYGAMFLPSMGVTLPITTVIPELDLYVRF
jgi:hypothetical protein